MYSHLWCHAFIYGMALHLLHKNMIYLSGEAGVDSPFHYVTVITPWWVVHCFHKRWKDVLLTSSLPQLVLMYTSLCNSLSQLHWRCLPLIAKLPALGHAQMSLYCEHAPLPVCVPRYKEIRPSSNLESIIACLLLSIESSSSSAVESEWPEQDF